MLKHNFLLLGLIFLLAACLPDHYGPDIASEQVNNATGYSNDQVRHMFVDQPYLASGDYFLRAGVPGSKEKQSGKEQAVEGQAKRTGNIARVEQPHDKSLMPAEQAVPGPVLPPSGGLKFKLALLSAPDLAGIQSWEDFCHQSAVFFQSNPQTLLIPTLLVCQALGKTGEKALYQPELKDLVSLADYPGLRILFFIKKLAVPVQYPGEALLSLRVFDFALGEVFDPPLFQARVENGKELKEFWQLIISKLWKQARQRTLIMPWFARIIYSQNGLLWINAGQDTGLHEGQVLEVIAEGQTVRSNGGMVLGWIPGRTKGQVRVVSFPGPGTACVRPLKAFQVEQTDILVMRKPGSE